MQSFVDKPKSRPTTPSRQMLLDSLKAAEDAIEEATDILFFEDGQPVTFLESHEIEHVYFALVSVMVQVHEALADSSCSACHQEWLFDPALEIR